jgi:hypothetical protein
MENEMIFQVNGIWKQAIVAILISKKEDFTTKLVRRDKGGHYILIQGTIPQEQL